MSQHYSNPARAAEPNALPDIEVFHVDAYNADDMLAGWYWWSCMPGCLPDSDAIGPFGTETDAVEDATKEGWSIPREKAVKRIRAWAAALKSGSYKQCTGTLQLDANADEGRPEDAFCCLGVYRRLGFAPSSTVAAGMLDANDWYELYGLIGEQSTWARYNDDDGWTFTEIAEELERMLDKCEPAG